MNQEDLQLITTPKSRIPEFDFTNSTAQSCDDWLTKLAECELVYHLDDDPANIVSVKHGKMLQLFSRQECTELKLIVDVIYSVQNYDPFDKLTSLIEGE